MNSLPDRQRWLVAVIPMGILLCATVVSSPIVALLAGFGAAWFGANRQPERWHRRSHLLLQLSVVGLGAGLDLPSVARAGMDGVGITFISISLIMTLGLVLGRFLGAQRHTVLLISAGTAICGGSAIAALASVLRPKQHETTVALVVVFLLNALALVLFPSVGHVLNLSQQAFGWWAALAIHDTSSVVGAGLAYGKQALMLATTIKLARALWIVPLSFALAHPRLGFRPKEEAGSKVARFPWFIAGFVGLAALVWLCPGLQPTGQLVFKASHHSLIATFFLIGAGLLPDTLRDIGWKPFILGLTLWIVSATGALGFAMTLR